jgi:hypothetical protein
MTLPVFGVHGIGVVDPYATAWEQAAAKGHLLIDVTEGRWPSTGLRTVDSLLIAAAMFGAPAAGFAARAAAAVAEPLREFLLTHRDGALVGHSMGAAVLPAALRLLAGKGELPHEKFRLVLIGAPRRNIVLGPALLAAGMGRPSPGPSPVHCHNPRDPICGPRPRHPSWMRGVVVETTGEEPDQHAAELYLAHPAVVRELRGVS